MCAMGEMKGKKNITIKKKKKKNPNSHFSSHEFCGCI